MTASRFVVLGVAPARAPWFRAVGQWAHAASLPLDFLKCVSPEEVRARLASGQPFSALLADAGVPTMDRDLVAAAARAECAVVIVEDQRVRRDWLALGAVATLPPEFGRDQLLGVLTQHAVSVTFVDDELPSTPVADVLPSNPALVVAVTGAGGTGTSTCAIALAQALADQRRRRVLLADFCLRAEQAMLHDVRDVTPGIQELVEAHRLGIPSTAEVRDLAFHVVERRYDLLLGLRRARLWSTLRPRAIEAAVVSLGAAYDAVVIDTDGDLEGENDGGSLDVEERNGLSRAAVQRADVVVAAGNSSMKGLHGLGVLAGAIGAAAPHTPVLAVANRAARSPRGRAEFTRALHHLVQGSNPDIALFGPIFLPERKVDLLLRDGARLPAALTQPLGGAVAALVAERRGAAHRSRPERLRPGTIGSWTQPAAG